MRSLATCLASAAFIWAGAGGVSEAQDAAGAGPIAVTANAPTFCSIGVLQGTDEVFDLGVLIDLSTGFLSPSLSAPPKTLAGAFCNAGSIIDISATPITAQTVGGAPASGYSDAVDFTATASGWTTTPAIFSTSTDANGQASQTRPTAFAGDIVVSIGDFSTAGGALRMMADPVYQGSVTLTLTVAN